MLAPGSPTTHTMRTGEVARSRPMACAASAMWAMKEGVPITHCVPYW
ncbi:Uncharacterised protein [Bordetella pertussis]|nr:Uncharacterised protein [Bordetella pertussis]